MSSRLLIGCLSIVVLIAGIYGGLSFSSSFGTSGSHVSVQLSPFVFATWPFAIVALVVSWRMTNFSETNITAKWPRILLALFVDFTLLLISVSVPVCFLALWLEYTQVGKFVWEFSRTHGRSTDIITLLLSFVMFGILFVSLSLFLINDRRTPGCLLAGIVLKLSKQVGLWRCSFFGLLKYFELALPILAFSNKETGEFEMTAQLIGAEVNSKA